ncbi:MAG: hypothetical protein KC502_06725 [Myxococcales bacterium]|nr:hypothetical protein [Myxococcales bacterium]
MLLGAQCPGLEVRAIHRGFHPHEVTARGLLASRGTTLHWLTDGGALPIAGLPTPNRHVARLPWVGPALRLGIQTARALGDDAIIAATQKGCWRGQTSPGEPIRWSCVLPFDAASHTTRRGLLVHGERVWLTEYARNPRRTRPIRLWRSDDGGRHFESIFRFSPGKIRHIHFIQRDPFTGDLWLGTGDNDAECGLYRSTDAGASWGLVHGGSQHFRAVGLAFLPDAIVWGTDAGRDAGHVRNQIIRLERSGGQPQQLCWLQGPAHGIGVAPDGDVWLATGVEGGANEHDSRVHVWHGRGGHSWTEVASFARGLQPLRGQYAIGHFADGHPQQEHMWLGLRGVLAGDVLTLEIARTTAPSQP